MTTSKPLIIYHAGCFDGFCAAWIARRYFAAQNRECEFIPANYGDKPPEVKDRFVYILDFSYPLLEMEEMARQSISLLVLDHHKTAKEPLERLFLGDGKSPREYAPKILVGFDMNKSGGRLTWEYFYPEMEPNWLTLYTEDRDLWRHKLPGSRQINAFLRSHPLDFALWDRLAVHGLTNPLENSDFYIEGRAILRSQQQVVESHVGFARPWTLLGIRGLIVNATTLISEIAGELAKKADFGCCYFVQHGEKGAEKIIFSLRSREDGIDVGDMARRMGGGGHRHASGFSLEADRGMIP